MVDPLEPGLRAFSLVDGEYAAVAHVTGTEAWTATEPFPVTIRPGDLRPGL